MPEDLDVHLILDNYGTHKTDAVPALAGSAPSLLPALHADRQLLAQPGGGGGSLNSRPNDCAGVGELVIAIHHFIDAYNDDPKPFVWTASVESILEKVNR